MAASFQLETDVTSSLQQIYAQAERVADVRTTTVLDGMIDGQLASEHEFAHLLGRVRFAQSARLCSARAARWILSWLACPRRSNARTSSSSRIIRTRSVWSVAESRVYPRTASASQRPWDSTLPHIAPMVAPFAAAAPSDRPPSIASDARPVYPPAAAPPPG